MLDQISFSELIKETKKKKSLNSLKNQNQANKFKERFYKNYTDYIYNKDQVPTFEMQLNKKLYQQANQKAKERGMPLNEYMTKLVSYDVNS
jgi:predicted HicB family RNase H-like nuclease